MPAILANAQNFLLNTDFPLDKIVHLKSGSFTVGGLTQGNFQTIPHNLGFIPLCNGNWSLTADFSVQYNYGNGIVPSSNPGALFDTVANVFADNTNVYISTDNANVSSRTIYYRIFALQPPDDDSTVAPVVSQGDTFVLNTDYNYTKLYLENYLDVPATGGTSNMYAVPHNLGYTSQGIGWQQLDTYNGTSTTLCAHPIGSTFSGSPTTSMALNPNAINFYTTPGALAHRLYYRLYLDE